MDDMTLLLSRTTLLPLLDDIEVLLHRMGLTLNRSKSEALAIRGPPLDLERLPKERPIRTPTFVMHLGHPIHHLGPPHAMELIVEELKSQLHIYNHHPLPSTLRVLLANVVLLPATLYRLEALPFDAQYAVKIQRLITNFVLDVHGIPLHISPKTLFTPRPNGLGLHHFPTRLRIRCLDTLHKAHLYHPLPPPPTPTDPSHHSPLQLFDTLLQPVLPPSLNPSISWDPPQVSRGPPILGFRTYSTPQTPLSGVDGTFSDGSFDPLTKTAGAAAVEAASGRVALSRTPGRQAIYPSELWGIILASTISPPGSVIHCDNLGAVQAVTRDNPVATHRWLVEQARLITQTKHQKVAWVKGHSGNNGNDCVDALANQARALPAHPAPTYHRNWHLVIEGLPTLPPHKSWLLSHSPAHTHTRISTRAPSHPSGNYPHPNGYAGFSDCSGARTLPHTCHFGKTNLPHVCIVAHTTTHPSMA